MMQDLSANFTILQKIGEGGMGEVFLGRDVSLEREVAIKSLRQEFASRPDIIERFRKEAVAIAKLHHPNIAMVYNFIHQGDQYLMVLEYVHGETLDNLIRRNGALRWADAVSLILQALSGLEHAHRAGVVHRDLKPSNMILDPHGVLKIMDFGIARVLQAERLTRVGHLVGTLEYMSPEQAKGLDADARSDLYTIGIVLFEMVTGHVPFENRTDYDLLRAQVEEVPPSPRQYAQHLPEQLNHAILRALHKSPSSRFQSATEMAVELRRILDCADPPPHLTPPRPNRQAFGLPWLSNLQDALGKVVMQTNSSWSRLSDSVAAHSMKLTASQADHSAMRHHLVSVARRYPGVLAFVALVAIAAFLLLLRPHTDNKPNESPPVVQHNQNATTSTEPAPSTLPGTTVPPQPHRGEDYPLAQPRDEREVFPEPAPPEEHSGDNRFAGSDADRPPNTQSGRRHGKGSAKADAKLRRGDEEWVIRR